MQTLQDDIMLIKIMIKELEEKVSHKIKELEKRIDDLEKRISKK